MKVKQLYKINTIRMSKKHGFTLIELLLVIGIIAILAVAVFVALDPAKRFADARDARRVSDVETILSALHQYVIDNKGAFPGNLSTDTEQVLGTASSGCANSIMRCSASADDCIDLTNELSKYLKTIPYDPQSGSSENTLYSIVKNSDGIVTVKACNAEGGEISASR